MWVNHWCWSSSGSGNRSRSAGAASGWSCIASGVTSTLVLEQLAQQTAVLLQSESETIARWSSGTRIASRNFSTAGWADSTTGSSDFSTAGWASATTSHFSAARRSGFATTAWCCMSSSPSGMLSSQLGMQASLGIVQFALQTLELVQDRGAASDRSTSGFNTAARSSTACTRIARRSSDFSATGWANATTGSHFSATARISDRGITARAVCTNAVSTQQSMEEFAAKALSAKASSQNHRSNKNIELHRTNSPYVHWVTDCHPHRVHQGGVETDFGARSRRRNRPRLARLWSIRLSGCPCDFVSPTSQAHRDSNSRSAILDSQMPLLPLSEEEKSDSCRPSHPSTRSVLGHRQFRPALHLRLHLQSR